MNGISPRRFRRLNLEGLESRRLLTTTPSGAEFAVNDQVLGVDQTFPGAEAAAFLDSGDLLAAYSDEQRINGAGPIRVRRFDGSDTPLGESIVVNQTFAGPQSQPSIDAGDDRFVVVWQGQGGGDHSGVFARWFDGDGNPLTGEILVNQTAGGTQENAAVALLDNGESIVVWDGVGSGDIDGVYFRRFNADGNPLGGEVLVNNHTADVQGFADIAISEDGSFTIAWSSRRQVGSSWDIFARQFNADGTPVDDEFQVNTTTDGSQFRPSMGMAADGSFVILWSSLRSTSTEWNVFGQRFDAGGQAVGGEFRVNANTAGQQLDVSVSVLPSGQFLAAWSNGVSGGSAWEVASQMFAANGQPDGAEVRGNQDTFGVGSRDQQFPTVAATPDGNAAIVWSGVGSGDGRGVFGHAFTFIAGNQPPSFELTRDGQVSDDPGDTVLEDSGPQTVEDFAVDISPGSPAETDQTVTFNIVDVSDPDLFAAAPALAPDGTLTYTPADDAFGTATITVNLSDDGGTADGGDDTSADQTFTITITPVNDAPSFTLLGGVAVDEDAPPQTFEDFATDIAAGPDNESDQTLTFNITDNSNAELFSAGPQISADGTLTFTPAQGASGTATITVELSDDGGTSNGGDDTSDAQSFTITIDSNLPPDLALPAPFDDPENPAAGEVGELIAFQAMATDPDGAPDGSDLTFQLDLDDSGLPENAAQPTIDQDGFFSWTPDTQGQFTFRVIVIDAGGKADQESFSIIISAANQPPDLALPAPFDDPGTPVDVEQGELIVIQAEATDPDGLADGSDLTFGLDLDGSGLPEGAALPTIDQDGLIAWTPDTIGQFTIIVLVIDAGGKSDQETFTVNVTEGNLPPDLTLPAPFDDPSRPVDIQADQLLQFQATATDPDGLPDGSDLAFDLDLDGSGLPQGAALPTIDQEGIFSWTPDTVGQFTITLVVTDAGGKSDQETFTVDVSAENLPPDLTLPSPFDDPVTSVELEQGQPTGFTATATDPDGLPDGSDLTFQLDLDGSGLPQGATLPTIDQNGNFTWTPDALGQFTIGVIVVDAGGKVDVETFTVDVVAFNQPPQLTLPAPFDDPGTAVESEVGQAIGFTAMATDPDGLPDGSDLTFQLDLDGSGLPQGAALPAIDQDGVISWTPDTVGQFTIGVLVIDAGGKVDQEVFTVDITSDNMPPQLTVPSPFDSGTPVGLIRNQPITFTVTATDPDGLPDGSDLTFHLDLSGSGISPTAPQPSIDSEGVFTWTPEATGDFPIVILVEDADGATDQQTVILRVVRRDNGAQASQAPASAPQQTAGGGNGEDEGSFDPLGELDPELLDLLAEDSSRAA